MNPAPSLHKAAGHWTPGLSLARSASIFLSNVIGRDAATQAPKGYVPASRQGTDAKLNSDARSAPGATLTAAFREGVTVRIRARNAGGRIVIGCRFPSPVASSANNPARMNLFGALKALRSLVFPLRVQPAKQSRCGFTQALRSLSSRAAHRRQRDGETLKCPTKVVKDSAK
jgi:hypothetical protein